MTDHDQPADTPVLGVDKPPLIVLDLGCSDGLVGVALKQAGGPLDPTGRGVDLYGIELDPQAAELARGRGYYSVKEGNAHQAPELFPTMVGHCDAVIAYELIEHVPDPDEFLQVCERMLKPGGRVYISTPDGCFGDGSNPHHLRALRAQDLANLLRRRGEIIDMQVGADTITTAAYTPATRVGEATIYCGPGWEAWSPADVDGRGLGGSETAAVHLARWLSKFGWIVTVYGEMDTIAFEQVLYRHHSTFDPLQPVDLLISSRVPELFQRPTRARRRMLWLHDIDCGDRLTREIASRLDHVLVLSGWHKRHVKGRYPFLTGEQLVQVRNGIDMGRFKTRAAERARRVLYTSSPDRGLDRILEFWPTVRDRVPDAELWACYSPVYQKIAKIDPTVAAFTDLVRTLADQPGVQLLPSQGQGMLAEMMGESLVWVAPSFNTPSGQPFHETSCIGAMEAQAAGLHVVASNWGALAETVKVGALVDGPPLSNRWARAFVEEIIRGLTHTNTIKHAQHRGPAVAVDSFPWGPVAGEISRLAGHG